MKTKFIFGLFLILFFAVLNAYSQDGNFIMTATSEKGLGYIYGSRAEIDHPALNGNSDALIIAAQLGGAEHFAGVWYLNGKWHVVNRDQSSMMPGTKFQIVFWTKPDATHFVHIVDVAKNLKTSVNGVRHSGVSYIDHPALNNHPNASFYHTQSTAGVGNPASTLPRYDDTLKQWYLTTIEGKPMLNLNRYNIAIINSGGPTPLDKSALPENFSNPTRINPTGTGLAKTDKIPEPLSNSQNNSPTGFAGGDLSGKYPSPTVAGLQGRPLSNLQPKIGDFLKWDGAEWKPAPNENPSNSTPAVNQTDAMPAQQQISATAVKTYYQKGDLNNWSQQLGFNSNYNFAQLKHNIQVPVKSRLVISAMINITGPICGLPPCFDGKGYFFTRVDGNTDENVAGFSRVFFTVGNLGLTSVTISNFMVDVQPGNHSIEFFAQHIDNTGGIKVKPTFSSVMVIPIE